MNLTLELKIDNLYRSKDFTDTKTGEVTKGKWKIQTLNKVESEDGEQIKLIDISIPFSVAKFLKDKIGDIVKINVGTYIYNNKVGYYGLDLNI